MKKTYSTNLNLRQIDIGLLFIRVVASGLLLTHGVPKLIKLFNSQEITFRDPLGLGPEITLALAVFAEFICSILVILGLGTRLAVIPIMATMLSAFLIVHWSDPFSRKELPILYFTIYTFILITGAGKYALDYYWLKRKRDK